MPDLIPLSAADLRVSMRDPRYWQPGHPEQAAYHAWVSEGWRQVSAREAGGDGMVWVAPYTRHRGGEAEEASGHYRRTSCGAPDGWDAPAGQMRVAEQDFPDGGRRITLRNTDGSLVGRCESLPDGSQTCTLGLPDGRVVVQELAARDGEIVRVGGPLAVPVVGRALMTAAVGVYNQLLNMPRPRRDQRASQNAASAISLSKLVSLKGLLRPAQLPGSTCPMAIAFHLPRMVA